MNINLVDGRGTGNAAGVSKDGRVSVVGVMRTQIQQASLNGDAYNISTGPITLTSAAQSAVLYLKNDGDADLVVKSLGVRIGATTGGGTNVATLDVSANSTGGTIISGASALAANSNLNAGSAKILEGDFYKGAQGNTLTGGKAVSNTATNNFTDPVSFAFGDAGFVLPKGTNVGLLFTPPTGNTSQTIIVFGILFYEVA